jgi:hypothetical protein
MTNQFYTLKLFKGEHNYNNVKIIRPETESELFTGVLNELNWKYNYDVYHNDNSYSDYYAEVYEDGGKEPIYTIIFLRKDVGQIEEPSIKPSYKFMALDNYDLTFVMDDPKFLEAINNIITTEQEQL